MLATTVYLSRLIGVGALICAVVLLYDKTMVVATLEHLEQDRAGLLAIGLIRVAIGAGIVLIHNVWARGFWPLVVTLTGWLMLVRGIMNLFLPPDVMAGLVTDAHALDFYYVYAAIPVLLGTYLGLRGFSETAVDADILYAGPKLSESDSED